MLQRRRGKKKMMLHTSASAPLFERKGERMNKRGVFGGCACVGGSV